MSGITLNVPFSTEQVYRVLADNNVLLVNNDHFCTRTEFIQNTILNNRFLDRDPTLDHTPEELANDNEYIDDYMCFEFPNDAIRD